MKTHYDMKVRVPTPAASMVELVALHNETTLSATMREIIDQWLWTHRSDIAKLALTETQRAYLDYACNPGVRSDPTDKAK
jgi:hypothetical protein